MIFQSYGQFIKSEVYPAWATNNPENKADIEIQFKKNSRYKLGIDWYHEISDEIVYCRYGFKNNKNYCLIPDVGCFEFDLIQNTIRVYDYSSEEACLPILLNQILPLHLSLQGQLVLHASVIESKGFATLFVANSGVGKSTVAKSLLQKGFHCLADDAALIAHFKNKVSVISSFPEIRLAEDMHKDLNFKKLSVESGKNRYDLGKSFKNGHFEVKQIFILERLEKVNIRELSALQSMPQILSNTYRMDLRNEFLLNSELQKISNLLQSVPVYQFEFNDVHADIDAVLQYIE